MSSSAQALSLQPKSNWLIKAARSRVFGFLNQLDDARIVIVERNNKYEFGHGDAKLSATVRVRDQKFYSITAVYGTIGAAEAYMAGYWDCDDLVTLIRIFAANLRQVEAMDGSTVNLIKWFDLICSRFNRNSLSGSSRNIARHYDLGNDFFELFLDQNMMYSSAIYTDRAATLQQASTNKLKVIAEKLAIDRHNHLLEIGTGWGGLAIYMANNYGCRVTTTTISNEQYHYALGKVKLAGLEGRIEVLKKDYRNLEGEFDKLVSVEMIEAVGHHYLPAYFQTCNRLLKPYGKMLIQAITMPEQRYQQAIKQVDFIQKYIFPGGCLPSVEVILKNIGKQTDLQLRGFQDITQSYAQTLADWRERFKASLSEVRTQGYDESFIRMWNFYLCYCEAGFRENSIGTSQLLFEKR